MINSNKTDAAEYMFVMDKNGAIMNTNLSSPGLLPLMSGTTRVARRTLATTTASAI